MKDTEPLPSAHGPRWPQVTLAFDGGMYEGFPVYRDMISSVLRQLLGAC